MKAQILLPIAAAAFVAAQDSDSNDNVSLTDALGSKNETLSQLGTLLNTQPDLVQALSQAQNITILAPSNDALEKLLNNTEAAGMLERNPGLITALLSYHVLNGTYYANDISENATFVPTLLMNETYSNVTGGQVVEVMKEDDTVSFISGLRMKANVTEANLNFTGGTIHIINEVLNLPNKLSSTAVLADLRALYGAVDEADLVSTVDTLKDVTVFAPSNAAFGNIGSAVGDLSEDDLQKILQYHIVTEGVFYSTDIVEDEMDAETAADEDVKIRVEDGSVFVNGAKVIVPDILFSGGVIHVIDQVLNPNNTDQEPNASSVEPAFSGASTASGGAVPFTSVLPSPTSSIAEDLQPEESGRAGSGQTGGGSGGNGGGNGEDGGDDGGDDDEDAGARPAIGAALGAVAAGAVLMLNLM